MFEDVGVTVWVGVCVGVLVEVTDGVGVGVTFPFISILI